MISALAPNQRTWLVGKLAVLLNRSAFAVCVLVWFEIDVAEVEAGAGFFVVPLEREIRAAAKGRT